MRTQTIDFIRRFIGSHNLGTKSLDVGSMDVTHNGTPRDFFPGYVGADMREGTNVDVKVNGHDLAQRFGEESFDVVMSFDCIEHDDRFWVTVDQMKKVLKPGGWILLGAPGRACPLHDHPNDYWRFMPESFKSLLLDCSDIHVETEMQQGTENVIGGPLEAEIYGYAQKT
jgi:SAM-dependent methyltransferase